MTKPSAPRGSAEPAEARRWRAAEGNLYPLIMVDPDAYEAAVTVVSEAAEVLHGLCGTVTELTRVDAAGVLARCPSASALTPLGVDPGTAFDAACAWRWRELTAPHADLGASAGGRR